MIEDGVLWKEVISRKFGVEEGGWSACAIREAYVERY